MNNKLKMTIAAMSSCLIFTGISYAAGNGSIVAEATGGIKDFLVGDARQVIDLGLLGGGAAASLMRSSWVPVMGGGIAMAVYEILVKVVA